jgi:hypothetical protein
LRKKTDPSFLPWPCPPSLFFFFHDHPTTSSNLHPQLTHFLLVDSLFRFESLRVAGVLDFCYWGSAASALALRFSSGTSEISLQPKPRALVLKSGRSSDVTAQAHPQPAVTPDQAERASSVIRASSVTATSTWQKSSTIAYRFAAAGQKPGCCKHIAACAGASSSIRPRHCR